jgi:hypothetical protein
MVAGLPPGDAAIAVLSALAAHLEALDAASPALRLAQGALDGERSAIVGGSADALATVVASFAMAVAVLENGSVVLLIDDLDGSDLALHNAVIDGLGAGSRRGFPLGVVVSTLVDPGLEIPGRVVGLDPLDVADLEDGARLPAAAKGRPVTNDALEAIALHSEGHPWLVQALMAAAWTPSGEAITGGQINQRVPVAQAGYRSAVVDPALARLGPGALRYLRAVATADVVTHTAVSQSLGDTNRFGGGGGSAMSDVRDELRRAGLLRSPDGDQLILPLPGQRLRLLADM